MSDTDPIAATLTELGYLSEAEAMAMSGLSHRQLLRTARLFGLCEKEPVDVHGRKVKDKGIPIGSPFGDDAYIYPRWNVVEFIRQSRIRAERKEAARTTAPDVWKPKPGFSSQPILAFHDAGPDGLFILSADLRNDVRMAIGPFRTVAAARKCAIELERDNAIDWSTFPAADHSVSA